MQQSIKIVFLYVCLFQFFICSQVKQQQQLALTVYSSFAIVKDTRVIQFDKGESVLYFTDVADKIQTATVTFKAAKEPETVRVYEQNFQNNLFSYQGILNKYIEKQITIYAQIGDQIRKFVGKLLGFNSGYILQKQDGSVEQFNKVSGIELPSLPLGFFTKPTLNWKVWSQKALQTPCQVAYRTTGFSWVADYSLILNNQQNKADLGGWVTIDNKSGKKYQNAKLKLIAGQVNIQSPLPTDKKYKFAKTTSLTDRKTAPQFKQKSFADYHMYTLSQPVTLNQQSQKQVQFVPKVYGIPIQKYYEISMEAGGSLDYNPTATKKIKFTNNQTNGLGIPFPKGIIRVFKQDQQDNSLQFIGQDRIAHSPKNQPITIMIGKAFDLTCKKLQTSRITTNNNGGYQAQLQFYVKNHKQQAADVLIKFNNYYGNNMKIQMIQGQQPESVSANEFRWRKMVAPGGTWGISWKEVKI